MTKFVAEVVGEDTIILKKITLRALLEDAIEKANRSILINSKEISKRRATDLPARGSRYLLDDTVHYETKVSRTSRPSLPTIIGIMLNSSRA